MSKYYVYEIVPIDTVSGDPNKKTSSHVRYPQGFDTQEEANAHIARKRAQPGFADTTFEVRPDSDDPSKGAEYEKAN